MARTASASNIISADRYLIDVQQQRPLIRKVLHLLFPPKNKKVAGNFQEILEVHAGVLSWWARTDTGQVCT